MQTDNLEPKLDCEGEHISHAIFLSCIMKIFFKIFAGGLEKKGLSLSPLYFAQRYSQNTGIPIVKIPI